MSIDASALARMLADFHDETEAAPAEGKVLRFLQRLEPRAEAPKMEEPPAASEERPAPEPVYATARRLLGEYGEALRRYREDFDRVFAADPEAAAGDDATLRRLKQAQTLLIKYPIAAQAAFAALVAEGRRYADTAEGAAWRRTLAESALVHQARTVWEATSSKMLVEHDGPLPGAFLEAFLEAADLEALEPLLARLFQAPTP